MKRKFLISFFIILLLWWFEDEKCRNRCHFLSVVLQKLNLKNTIKKLEQFFIFSVGRYLFYLIIHIVMQFL
jgi:hypothetical protein